MSFDVINAGKAIETQKKKKSENKTIAYGAHGGEYIKKKGINKK